MGLLTEGSIGWVRQTMVVEFIPLGGRRGFRNRRAWKRHRLEARGTYRRRDQWAIDRCREASDRAQVEGWSACAERATLRPLRM